MYVVNAIIYPSAMKHSNNWTIGEIANDIKDDIVAR